MKSLPVMIETLHGEMRKSKKLVLHKNPVYNAYFQDRNNADLFNIFQFLHAHFKTTIEESKPKYY